MKMTLHAMTMTLHAMTIAFFTADSAKYQGHKQ